MTGALDLAAFEALEPLLERYRRAVEKADVRRAERRHRSGPDGRFDAELEGLRRKIGEALGRELRGSQGRPKARAGAPAVTHRRVAG